MIDNITILISLIVLSIIVFVATTYLLSVGPNHKWYNRKMAVAIGLLGGSIAISLVTIPLALPSSDKILLPLDVWYSSQLKSYSSSSIISFVVQVPSYAAIVDQQLNVSIIIQNKNMTNPENIPIQVGVNTFSITLYNYEATIKPAADLNVDITYDKISNTFGVKLTSNENNRFSELDFICRLSSPPFFVFTPAF